MSVCSSLSVPGEKNQCRSQCTGICMADCLLRIVHTHYIYTSVPVLHHIIRGNAGTPEPSAKIDTITLSARTGAIYISILHNNERL